MGQIHSRLCRAGGVCFCTDLEGNWEYFLRFVALSEALTFNGLNEDGSMSLTLEPHWQFVHGGDACDKGGIVGGSLRVVSTLVRLKRKYPDRVRLILGNRDLNKMRITSELSDEQLSNFEIAPGPLHIPAGPKRISPFTWLQRLCAAEEGIDLSLVTDEMVAARNTLVNRVKWMLSTTMGADGEFERRIAELDLLREHDPAWASMDTSAREREAAQTFVDWVKPGSGPTPGHGDMLALLELGELAVVIQKTLYVHGGVMQGTKTEAQNVASFGLVPGHSATYANDISKWCHALHAFKTSQITAWRQQPRWAECSEAAYEAGRRGGNALIEYCCGMGVGENGSVVQGRHLDSRSMPALVPTAIVESLNGCGITRLVVGHTPHGNAPTIIKQGGPGKHAPCFEVVMADTSYSDMRAVDNRGAATAEVCVLRDGTVRVRGELEDGRPIAYALKPGVGPADELVGRLEPTPVVNRAAGASCSSSLSSSSTRAPPARAAPLAGAVSFASAARLPKPEPRYFGKAILTTLVDKEPHLLLSHVDGFVVTYAELPLAQARQIFMGDGGNNSVSRRNRDLLMTKASEHTKANKESKDASARRGGSTGAVAQMSSGRSRRLWQNSTKQLVLALRLMNVGIQYSSTGDDTENASDITDARDELVARIFAEADQDDSGSIEPAEFASAIQRDASWLKLLAGTGCAPIEIEALITAMDTNHDGKVQLDEVRRFCARRPPAPSVLPSPTVVAALIAPAAAQPSRGCEEQRPSPVAAPGAEASSSSKCPRDPPAAVVAHLEQVPLLVPRSPSPAASFGSEPPSPTSPIAARTAAAALWSA